MRVYYVDWFRLTDASRVFITHLVVHIVETIRAKRCGVQDIIVEQVFDAGKQKCLVGTQGCTMGNFLITYSHTRLALNSHTGGFARAPARIKSVDRLWRQILVIGSKLFQFAFFHVILSQWKHPWRVDALNRSFWLMATTSEVELSTYYIKQTLMVACI